MASAGTGGGVAVVICHGMKDSYQDPGPLPAHHLPKLVTQLLSFAPHPGCQQVFEARCCKNLGIMDLAQELGPKFHEDALMVVGCQDIKTVEAITVVVNLWLLLGGGG